MVVMLQWDTRRVNSSTPRPEGLGLPFDKLRALNLSKGSGLTLSRAFFPGLKGGGWRRRMGQEVALLGCLIPL